MGLLDSIKEGFRNAVLAAMEIFKDVPKFVEKATELVDHVLKGDFSEAVEMVGEAISGIQEKLQLLVELPVKAIEILTGVTLESIGPVVEALGTVGKFLSDAIKGMVDLPREAWLPIAVKVIGIARCLATGNWAGGIIGLIGVIQDINELKQANPEKLERYEMPPQLEHIELKEDFRSLPPAMAEQKLRDELPLLTSQQAEALEKE